jgi:hypothetical protein
VGGGTVGKEDGVAGVDSQSLGIEVDGSTVILLGHGSVTLRLKGLSLLSLLLGELDGCGGSGSGRLVGAGLLEDRVDLEEVLGSNGSRDSRGIGRVDLEGLSDAVNRHIDGVLVVSGESAVIR